MIFINEYEVLLDEAADNGILVLENMTFESDCDGLIRDNIIGLSNRLITTTRRATIAAEELGHFYTTTGLILDQTKIENRKQELKARLWAYDRLIGLTGLIRAYEHGCHDRAEVAEYLNVTEDFLEAAIESYENKYGVFTVIDNYVIRFIPYLGIAKML